MAVGSGELLPWVTVLMVVPLGTLPIVLSLGTVPITSATLPGLAVLWAAGFFAVVVPGSREEQVPTENKILRL